MKLSINRCLVHPNRWSVAIDRGNTGTRIAGIKCCGRWETVASWRLDAEVWTFEGFFDRDDQMRQVDKLDIAAIRARAQAATPGPWERINEDDNMCASAFRIKSGEAVVACEGCNDFECPGIGSEGDAAFISASRTDVPALCDALEAAVREIAHRDEQMRQVDKLDVTEIEARAKASDIPALIAEVKRLQALNYLTSINCPCGATYDIGLPRGRGRHDAEERAEAAEARVRELEAQLEHERSGSAMLQSIHLLRDRVRELEAQLATARDDALEEAATVLRSAADVQRDDCEEESLRKAARMVVELKGDKR